MNWRFKPDGYRSLGIAWTNSGPFGRTLIVSLWRWEWMKHWHDEQELEALRALVSNQDDAPSSRQDT